MISVVPEITEEVVDPIAEEFNFIKCKPQIDQIIGSWSGEISEAEIRRKERYIDLDVQSLRDLGKIAKDETFIPNRVIDANIRSEKSDSMAFLNAGFRLAIFKCLSNPSIDCRNLELEFTDGMTYEGWYREYNRMVDGALLHGWAYIEVVFDETKPLHVGFEYVPFDKIMYNRKVEDIQSSEWLIRQYEIPVWKLEEFRDQFGFDSKQVANILQHYEQTKRNDVICVYRCYFKKNNCVYVSWFSRQGMVNDWIKQPAQLSVGITNENGLPVECDIYNVFQYLFYDDEQPITVDHKGRGFLDGPQQEAQTAIVTSYVNSTIRASAIYASPKTDDGDSAEMKQLDIELVPDGIYNKPIDFFSKPYPDVTMLYASQYIDTMNKAQSGKIAAAVSNRKDSRKTKEELVQAKEESQKINSTELGTFSEVLRAIFTFSWRIVQSQALQSKIIFLLKEEPIIVMGTQTGTHYVNDVETISQVFSIRPAGDTDIIEAQQEQVKMEQDWPVLQTTPLAPMFLQDYIKLRYPKRADAYIAELQKADPKNLVASLSTMLQAALSPEEIAAMPPETKQQLAMIQQQVQQLLGQQAGKPAQGAQ